MGVPNCSFFDKENLAKESFHEEIYHCTNTSVSLLVAPWVERECEWDWRVLRHHSTIGEWLFEIVQWKNTGIRWKHWLIMCPVSGSIYNHMTEVWVPTNHQNSSSTCVSYLLVPSREIRSCSLEGDNIQCTTGEPRSASSWQHNLHTYCFGVNEKYPRNLVEK